MIREKRLEKGLSQLELSRKLNISRGYLSLIENRQFSNLKLSLIKDISKTLGIDIYTLIKWLMS